MSLTIAKVFGPVSIGDRFMTVNTIAFDASYPTGGEPLAATDLGFAVTTDDQFHVHIAPSAGYVFEYDHTNKKVKAYQQKDPAAAGGADIPLPQVGDTTDLSAITGVRVTAYSRYRK